MDILLVASGVTAIAGFGVAWHAIRRARRAEAKVTALSHELQAERHAASHDALTGLPNRRAFYQLGTTMLATPGRRLVAVVLDLDNFKQINDRYGHAAGDEVLIAVAQRFSGYAKDRLVARLGGDEFAGLITGPADDDGWLRQAALRLTDLVAAPIQIAGRLVMVTASVGLAPVPTGSSLSEALCRADAAMYRVKGHDRRNGLSRLTSCPEQIGAHPRRPLQASLVDGFDARLAVRSSAGRHPPSTPSTARQLVEMTRRTDTGGP